MNTAVVLCLITAFVVLIIIFVFRNRLSMLSFDGSKAKMEAKIEPKIPEFKNEESKSVVFTRNTIRGDGTYRMRNTVMSDNDVDGKQKLELGYDEPSGDVTGKEN